MTPTQRSLAMLRRAGFLAVIVEKWNHVCKIRQDLFGFADILAVKGDEVLLVQTTTGAHVAERIAKIAVNPISAVWLASPHRKIVVHGWRKVGDRGKRKLWECREENVEPVAVARAFNLL